MSEIPEIQMERHLDPFPAFLAFPTSVSLPRALEGMARLNQLLPELFAASGAPRQHSTETQRE
jgi:hypothetical protein